MSLCLKSHTLAQLRQAVANGNRLFELDTGSAGEDDVLFGMDADEVTADVLFSLADDSDYQDDELDWPAGWTLRELSPAEVRDLLEEKA